MLLTIEQIHTHIQGHHILQGVSFQVPPGEVTVLLGRNGAGKTTTLRTLMGMTPASKGRILFRDIEIGRLSTDRIARAGIGYVPEDQSIFGSLTVEENMKVAIKKLDAPTKKQLDWILELFPDLKKFWHRKSGWLSGGQKQMLAIARALIQNQELLVIDEPSKGLAPIVVDSLVSALNEIKQQTTILLVEQNFSMASALGDHFVLLDDGRTVATGKMSQLINDESLRRKYLGVAG